MKKLTFLFISTVLLFACEKDPNVVTQPSTENEEELITSVELELISGNDTVKVKIADPDGDGGNAPIIDTLRLQDSTTYAGIVRFLDESGAVVKNLSTEIEEEADEHLICYTPGQQLSISILDTDSKGFPVGLRYSLNTAVNGSSSLGIRLKHQPGIKNGDCDRGETDVEVNFPVIIQ